MSGGSQGPPEHRAGNYSGPLASASLANFRRATMNLEDWDVDAGATTDPLNWGTLEDAMEATPGVSSSDTD